MSQRGHLRILLVLMLAVPFSSYAASSGKAAVPEQGASIPTYQWQFLSPSEKAAVDASMKAIMNEHIKNITLNTSTNAGVPYTGSLQVTQTSTGFIYTAGWPPTDNWNDYLAMTPSHTQFSLYAPWSKVEFVRGQWDFSGPDYQYSESVEHGLTEFHLFLGPYYGQCCPDYSVPDWEKALEKSARSNGNASDYESLMSDMRNYVEAVVSHFKGRVQLYELWWEANAWYGDGNWSLNRVIDIIKMEALTIRATDPAAKISVDLVYVTPDTLPYLEPFGSSNWTTDYFVQQLLAAGVPFDVLGLETHIGTGGADTAGDVATLYSWLNELAKFGKPIYIWEDGLESYLPSDWLAEQRAPWWVGTWHGTPSEAKQAEYMVAETLVYLGNPSVIGLHWVLLYDQSPWVNNLSGAGVLYANGTKKMSFYALRQFWSSLMLNGTVQSVNGVASFRGLAGNYSVSAEGYEVEPSTFHISEGESNTFSFRLRSSIRTTTSVTSVGSTKIGAYYATAQTSTTPVLPTNYMEYLAVVLVLGAIAIGAIWISGKRTRLTAAAKERPRRGVQFCINCGVELSPNSKFCIKCGSAQT